MTDVVEEAHPTLLGVLEGFCKVIDVCSQGSQFLFDWGFDSGAVRASSECSQARSNGLDGCEESPGSDECCDQRDEEAHGDGHGEYLRERDREFVFELRGHLGGHPSHHRRHDTEVIA